MSDEIWSDLIMPGYRHIPTQLGSEYLKYHTVACYSPTKTFNIANYLPDGVQLAEGELDTVKVTVEIVPTDEG